MTDREKAIVMAYTGCTMLAGDKLGIYYKYVQEKLGRSVMTHELAYQEVQDAIAEAAKEDFIAIAKADNGWISVQDRLPESGEHVLVCCEIRPSKKRYVCDGFYASKHSIGAHFVDDDFAYEYDEEADEYFLLEGWYEVIKNWDDYSSIVIDDFVTHWMPLPEPPKEGT